MALDKKSFQADGLANLYRAAFFLAKNNKKTALEMLKKASQELNIKNFVRILDKPRTELKTTRQQLFWAEKILDQFQQLKRKYS